MKYAKMLGLLAIAAAALLAFAGTASATLTGPSGTLNAGAVIEAESEGATSLDGTIQITCQRSTVRGEVTANGGTSITVNNLTFTECGKNTVTVVAQLIVTFPGGSIDYDAGSLSINSSTNAVTSSFAEVTVLTHNILGTVHCIYETLSTNIGTLTESSTTGTNATLDIGSAGLPQNSTDFGCSNDAVWTGNYKVTNPSTLNAD